MLLYLILFWRFPLKRDLDQERVRQAYQLSVKEFGQELLAKQELKVKDGKSSLIGIVSDSDGTVVKAFKNRKLWCF